MLPGILITDGPKRGLYLRFEEGKLFWIGRAAEADLRLEKDQEVSGKHCSLERKGGNLFLTDQSKNGTKINGRKLHKGEVQLNNTDIICVGETYLQVIDLDDSTPEKIEFDAKACLKALQNHEPREKPAKVLDRIGPYVNIEIIGRGASGLVYKSVHKDKEELVALKVLTNLEQNNDFVSRFLREMSLLQKLKHSSIITLYDAGVMEVRGYHYGYMALEYFQGVDLKDHLKLHGPLPWQKVFKILFQITNALIYMHSQGVLHRDLKPHNIMYNDIKQVAKIIDLGLAKCIVPEESQNLFTTQTGSLLGTPNFMPLEQWKSSKTVDERADIYSLGVTAYFILTGKLPYGRNDNLKSLYYAILEQDIIPLETIASEETPKELIQIIMKMMKPEISERYATVKEILLDLKTILETKYEEFN